MAKFDIPLGTVIARREFEFESADGESTQVVVKIGAPVPHPEYESTYCCPYEIDGPRKTRLRYQAGVDSMQALLLTLQIISSHFIYIEREDQGTFSYLGGTDIGLPDPPGAEPE